MENDYQKENSFFGGGMFETADAWLKIHTALIIAVLVVLILLFVWLGCYFGKYEGMSSCNSLLPIGCSKGGYGIGGAVVCMQQDDSSYDLSSGPEKKFDAYDRCQSGQDNFIGTSQVNYGEHFQKSKPGKRQGKSEGFDANQLATSINAQGGPAASASWYTVDGNTAVVGMPSNYSASPSSWIPASINVPNAAGTAVQSVVVYAPVAAQQAPQNSGAPTAALIDQALAQATSANIQSLLGCPDLNDPAVQRQYATNSNSWQWLVKQMGGNTAGANAPAFIDPSNLAASQKFTVERMGQWGPGKQIGTGAVPVWKVPGQQAQYK